MAQNQRNFAKFQKRLASSAPGGLLAASLDSKKPVSLPGEGVRHTSSGMVESSSPSGLQRTMLNMNHTQCSILTHSTAYRIACTRNADLQLVGWLAPSRTMTGSRTSQCTGGGSGRATWLCLHSTGSPRPLSDVLRRRARVAPQLLRQGLRLERRPFALRVAAVLQAPQRVLQGAHVPLQPRNDVLGNRRKTGGPEVGTGSHTGHPGSHMGHRGDRGGGHTE